MDFSKFLSSATQAVNVTRSILGDDTQNELRRLETENNALTREVTQLRQLRDKVSQLEKSLSDRDNLVGSLLQERGVYTAQTNEMKVLQREKENASNAVSALRAMIESLEVDKTVMKAKLLEVTNEKRQLEEQLSEKTVKICQLDQELLESRESLARSQEAWTKRGKLCSNLSTIVDEAKEEIQKNKEKITALEQQLEESMVNSAQLVQRIQAENESILALNGNLFKENSERLKENTAKLRQISYLETRLRELEEKLFNKED